MRQSSQHHAMHQTTQLRDGDRGKKRRGMLQTSTALCSFHAIWVSAVLSATCAQAASPFAYWNPQDAAQNWSGNNNWCFEAVTTCHPDSADKRAASTGNISESVFHERHHNKFGCVGWHHNISRRQQNKLHFHRHANRLSHLHALGRSCTRNSKWRRSLTEIYQSGLDRSWSAKLRRLKHLV